MSYFPVLPGAVDDAATPAPSPKMHGLHGHDAGSAVLALAVFPGSSDGFCFFRGPVQVTSRHPVLRFETWF